MFSISDINPSLHFGKRYVATVETPDGIKKIHFGQEGAFTYIDGAPEKIKEAYLARHMANPRENYLITHLIPSPALFSARLLWGDSRNLHSNVVALNKLWINY